MNKLLLVLAFVPVLVFAQSKKQRKALEAQHKVDQEIIINLKGHVNYLSSVSAPDSALTYITNQLKTIGIKPAGTDGFYQTYIIDAGKKYDNETYLKVNDVTLEPGKEFFPFPFSANKKVTGMPAMALRERGVPWFTDLKQVIEANPKDAEKIQTIIKIEAGRVAAKGATALFVYNTAVTDQNITFNAADKSTGTIIPVIFITNDGLKKHFSDHSDMLDIELNVAIKDNHLTEKNLAGYIDNGAASTVIINAPYKKQTSDSLNELATRMSAAEAAITIEISKMLAAAKAKNNNYLILFTGNDKAGTDGLHNWLGKPTIQTAANYLLKVDNIVPLTSTKKIQIDFLTLSHELKEVITSIKEDRLMLNIDTTNFVVSNTAFDIPALSFSGVTDLGHQNDTIDYDAALAASRYIVRLVEAADLKGKLLVTKITVPATTTAAVTLGEIPVKKEEPKKVFAATKTSYNPTVSLGVIPDKKTSNEGMKIYGVSPKKLAAKLGLQAGDVIKMLGSYSIIDVNSYMQALTNFKVGDKTILKIKRGTEDKEIAVVF